MFRFKVSKLFLITLAVVILFDQSSKILAQSKSEVMYNSGVTLGLFTLVPKAFLSIALLALLLIVGWTFRSIWQQIPLASGLFFGGGFSNLVDRFFLGSVRDWLPIPLTTIHNNLADYAIGLGLISMIVLSLRKTYVGKVDVESSSSNQNEMVEAEDEEK